MKKIISLLLALVLTLSACSVALAADVVLRPGDKGDAVKEVQTLLTSYGYYSGKINGSYNTATTTAVRNFQRDHSLTVDGIAGKATQAALYAAEDAPQPTYTVTLRQVPEAEAIALTAKYAGVKTKE